MADASFYNLNFRMLLHGFTRDYANFADLVESIDNERNIATSNFHGLHKGLIRDLDLDSDATPADVILAVYAFYRANGGEATTRMICEHPVPAVEWFAQFAA